MSEIEQANGGEKVACEDCAGDGCASCGGSGFEWVWFEADPALDLLERFVNEADQKWPRGQNKKLPGPTMYGVISDARRLLKAHGRRGLGA
jgi:hypothetical protein